MPKAKKEENANAAVVTDDQQIDDLQIDEGDYDAAFDEATEDIGAKPDGIDDGSADKKDDEPSPPSAEEPPAEEPPVEEPPTETPAPSAADVEALRSRNAELERQLAEQTKPPEKPQPEEPPKPLFNEDEQEVLDEVAEDWPSIVRAMELRNRELEAKLSKLIDQKIGTVQEQIKPIAKTTQESAQERFKATITQAHADAFALLPEVEKWIEGQPDYLQPGYNHVLDRGSAKQVIDLLTHFKEATGRLEPEDKGATPPEQDGDKSGRLARMEGVRTQRTGLSVDDDPSDFDGAFERAASQ